MYEYNSLKIHEVALAVSYDSSAYFVKLLKKITATNRQGV